MIASTLPTPIRMAIGISKGIAIRISIGMAIGTQRVCVRLSFSYGDGYKEFCIGMAIGAQRVCVSLPSSYRHGVRDLHKDVYKDGYKAPPFAFSFMCVLHRKQREW